MMRYLLYSSSFIGLALTISCASDTLNSYCPQYCWHSNKLGKIVTSNSASDYPLTSPCSPGTTKCDEQDRPVDCDYPNRPAPEICNDIDDNCDGKVDEDIIITSSGNHLAPDPWPCFTQGECKESLAICEAGEWYCEYLGDTEFPEETSCDGLDNDCDARVDEDIYVDQPCFDVPDGEWWRATHEECEIGLYACVNGNKKCIGQSLPSTELCDGKDNDCNGIVDDVEQETDIKFDIIYNIDTSGSMTTRISDVVCMLDTFASQFEGNSNYRFALVDMSSRDYDVELLEDLTSFNGLRQRIQALESSGSAVEYSLDSMYMLGNKEDNPLGISFRDDAASIVFSFTDEEPQSHLLPSVGTEDVIDISQENNIVHYIWSHDFEGFEDIAIDTGGLPFALNACQSMVEDAQVVNNLLCVPE